MGNYAHGPRERCGGVVRAGGGGGDEGSWESSVVSFFYFRGFRYSLQGQPPRDKGKGVGRLDLYERVCGLRQWRFLIGDRTRG